MSADLIQEKDRLPNVHGHAPLTDKEFDKIRELIYEQTGIHLADHKRALVYSRLARRLRHHGLKSYTEYYQFVRDRDRDGREMVEMINCITTNKTEFFREPHHFDFLRDTVFPQYKDQVLQGGNRRIRIWCSAASTGQEPYTIAMTVRECFGKAEGWDIKILATDIDTSVLDYAEKGTYKPDQAESLTNSHIKRFFHRGRGDREGYVTADSELKNLIAFRKLNLQDNPWPMKGPFDIIFCRNVIIYFDKPTQNRLIHRMKDLLKPGGYLMLGHSEALHGIEHGFEHHGKNIYRVPEKV